MDNKCFGIASVCARESLLDYVCKQSFSLITFGRYKEINFVYLVLRVFVDIRWQNN